MNKKTSLMTYAIVLISTSFILMTFGLYIGTHTLHLRPSFFGNAVDLSNYYPQLASIGFLGFGLLWIGTQLILGLIIAIGVYCAIIHSKK